MTRLRRTNLANALFYLPRPALVLVPILLKGLTVIVTLGVAVWLESTWMDLCFLAGVMGYTLLRWNALRYALDGEVLRMQEGIWFRKTTAIPADRISVVASVRPFLLRPFGVCLIEADTPAAAVGRISGSIFRRRIPGHWYTPIPMGISTCRNSSSTAPGMPVCCCSPSLPPIH